MPTHLLRQLLDMLGINQQELAHETTMKYQELRHYLAENGKTPKEERRDELHFHLVQKFGLKPAKIWTKSRLKTLNDHPYTKLWFLAWVSTTDLTEAFQQERYDHRMYLANERKLEYISKILQRDQDPNTADPNQHEDFIINEMWQKFGQSLFESNVVKSHVQTLRQLCPLNDYRKSIHYCFKIENRSQQIDGPIELITFPES